jgi:hypothetical protein
MPEDVDGTVTYRKGKTSRAAPPYVITELPKRSQETLVYWTTEQDCAQKDDGERCWERIYLT